MPTRARGGTAPRTRPPTWCRGGRGAPGWSPDGGVVRVPADPGVDEARHHDVGPDRPVLAVERHRADQCRQARLRRLVGNDPSRRAERGDRRGEHDRRPCCHHGQRGAHREHGSPQVHGEGAVPRLRCRRLEPGDSRNPDVVRDAVDASEPRAARSTMASTSPGSATSAVTAVASPPAASMSSTVASAAAVLASTATTLAPSRARSSEIARAVADGLVRDPVVRLPGAHDHNTTADHPAEAGRLTPGFGGQLEGRSGPLRRHGGILRIPDPRRAGT